MHSPILRWPHFQRILFVCCTSLVTIPAEVGDIAKLEAENGCTVFGRICIQVQKGVGAMFNRADGILRHILKAQIQLQFVKDNNKLSESKPKIFVGPLPGIRYSVEHGDGKIQDRYFVQVFKKDGNRIFGMPYFEWYAKYIEHEFTDIKMEQVYDNFRKDVFDVISGFKLPFDDPSAAADFFREKFKAGVISAKEGSTDEGNLVLAASTFSQQTEEYLTNFGLDRNGTNMPRAISLDPWLLNVPRNESDLFCGNFLCPQYQLSFGDYVLQVNFLHHYMERRLNLYADRLREINVSHVATVISQRELMSCIHPYTLPYGQGLRLGQEHPVAWDGTRSAFWRMIDDVRESIGQEKRGSGQPFAVASTFLNTRKSAQYNLLLKVLNAKDMRIEWPTWERDVVPHEGWPSAVRYALLPILKETLRKGENIYAHGKGANGRVGFFIIIFLLEFTQSYWLDIVKLVRSINPMALENAQQVLYVEWYWRKYTAKYLPASGQISDESNWDTAMPEMNDICAPNTSALWRSVSEKYKTLTLREALRHEREEMSKRMMEDRLLIADDAYEKTLSRRTVGVVLCTLLYVLLFLIIGFIAIMLYCGPSLDPKRAGERAYGSKWTDVAKPSVKHSSIELAVLANLAEQSSDGSFLISSTQSDEPSTNVAADDYRGSFVASDDYRGSFAINP